MDCGAIRRDCIGIWPEHISFESRHGLSGSSQDSGNRAKGTLSIPVGFQQSANRVPYRQYHYRETGQCWILSTHSCLPSESMTLSRFRRVPREAHNA